MKRTLLSVSLVLLTLVSCSLYQFNPFKRVINYPMPEVKMDNTLFSEMGCFNSVDCLPDELKNIDAPITAIYTPSDLLGGLNPQLPLAVASTITFYDDPEVTSVYRESCMATNNIRYLVVVDDEMRLIDSAEKMKELYAPIESEDEALAYAMAVTGLSALYSLDTQPRLKHLTKPLEESHSTFDGEVFHVHLFDTNICGCGPHITESVEVTVHQDGTLEKADPVEAFRDPELDGLCID